MSKRLRGWALEKEKSATSTSSASTPSTQKSELATRLLSLWAHGLLSAVIIRELAHLSLLAGASHPELAEIAKAGSFGEHPANITRDLMQSFCKESHMPEALGVSVQCTDPKTSDTTEVEAGVFLPHVLFAQLGAQYWEQFKTMFAVERLAEFWNGVEATGDERLIDHPMKADSDWKQKCIPIYIHADGVEFQSRDTLLAWSWGGLLALFNSLDCEFLLSFFPKSCTSDGTWSPIMRWITWSFKAMLEGVHPSADPDNKPLKRGSPFYTEKGKPLVPGFYKGIIWSVQGDHDMFSNVLKLPHWRNFQPCWECDCTNARGPADKRYSVIQPRLQNWAIVTNAQAKAHPRSPHELFRAIPGLTTRFCRGDALHILWHNGLYSHLLGSILHRMCFADPPGARQRVDPKVRLGIIFTEIQKSYRTRQAPARLTNLKMSMFCKFDAPWAKYPALSTKAAESKHLAPALLDVCRVALNSGSEVDQHILAALTAMCSLVDLLDQADIFLTDAQSREALNLAYRFLDEYAWLNAWAESEDLLLFNAGALKFHTFFHLIDNARFLNPRFHWTFRNEDFVGKVSLLAHSASMGVRATKLSMKACAKYRILLHLRLTRPNFGQLPNAVD